MEYTPPPIIPYAIIKYADKYYPHKKIKMLDQKYTYINDDAPPNIATRKFKKLSNLENKKVYAVFYVYPDGHKMGIPYLLIKENKIVRHANRDEIGEIYKNNYIVDHTPSYVPEAVIKKIDEHFPFVTSSGEIRWIHYRTTWKNYEVYCFYYYLYEPKLVGRSQDILYDCTDVRFPNKAERWDLGLVSPAYPQKNAIPTLCKNKLKKITTNN